ncbi:MAG: ChuX/HutX family heme-like substrate-binding protein [Bacteroidota bacterium]
MTRITLLKQQLSLLKEQEPKLRNRDLAKRLAISEAELVSLDVGDSVTRLGGNWKVLLQELKSMGHVMALSRNEYCVHERKGVYDNIEFYEGPHNMGVAVNEDIDLRFFMNEWEYGLAVIKQHGKIGILYSFQFFNKRGEAVHKVYSTPTSDIYAYHQIVKNFRDPNQDPIIGVDTSEKEKQAEKPDSEIDVESFQEDWRQLQDTHHFFGLLRKYGLTREQGFRLAPSGFTHKVNNQSVIQMLQAAANKTVPIMCFVNSPGCIQIHTGPVKNLKFFGDWYNVMDPKFNLHLNMKGVHSSWIVKKPTEDGLVTSLELFDQEGNQIVYFFGARKPGKSELEEWRELIHDLETNIQIHT